MNWYRYIKLAQIDIKYQPEDFSDYIQALYELEYKYSAVKSYQFNGHPRRRENILNSLKKNLTNIINHIKVIILKVFSNWLSSHALLSSGEWGKQRMMNSLEVFKDEYGNSMNSPGYDLSINLLNHFMNDYIGHVFNFNRQKTNVINFQVILEKMANNIEDFPVFRKFLEHEAENHKEFLLTDLEEEGYEEFGSRFCSNYYTYFSEFASDIKAREFIQNLSLDDIGADQILEFTGIGEDIESFAAYVDINSDLSIPALLQEMYAYFVFPLWYKRWEKEGIEQTRANIQKIYDDLRNSDPNNIEDTVIKIDRAINTSHQTGSMLEYLEEFTSSENLSSVLDEISSKTNVDGWNEELKEVGVQII